MGIADKITNRRDPKRTSETEICSDLNRRWCPGEHSEAIPTRMSRAIDQNIDAVVPDESGEFVISK